MRLQLPMKSCVARCRRARRSTRLILRALQRVAHAGREALRQLAASGLVDARAHRGAVVARPSIERLTGMFEAMAELERCAQACRGAHAAFGAAPARSGPRELRVLSYAGNPDRFHEVNERFHTRSMPARRTAISPK